MTHPIELRSDTFTRPTPDMRRAMYEAEVGDDVWGEDPTVHRLEALAAELTGKEAAVFVTSGTQGNLVGVLSHTRRGDEVILGDRAHIFHYESGGTAVVGGVQLRTLPNRGGRLDPVEVDAAIRPEDPHNPWTGLVSLENTHNKCGGAVVSRADMDAVAEVAHGNGIPVHLDGARVFNASVALGMPVRDLVASMDSLTFCLSKGLGAPVGSVLCGTADYIHRARHWRKMLGGGTRQAGILAAAGIFALENNVDRLAEDHANARRLAEGLANIPSFSLDPEVQSNIVFFDATGLGIENEEFVRRMNEHGIRIATDGPLVRAVTSYEVDAADIERVLQAAQHIARELQPALV